MTQTLEANARDAARDVAITRRLATVAGLIEGIVVGASEQLEGLCGSGPVDTDEN